MDCPIVAARKARTKIKSLYCEKVRRNPAKVKLLLKGILVPDDRTSFLPMTRRWP